MADFGTQRASDWFKQLQGHLSKSAAIEFTYGGADCYEEVIGGIDLMLGTSYLADFKETYSCEKSALKAMKKAGFRSFVDYLDTFLEPVPAAFAKIGDAAVIVDNDGREHFAFCMGLHWRVKAPEGILRFGPQSVKQAFKVG